MNSKQQLKELLLITQAAFQIAQMDLAKLRHQEAELVKTLRSLSDSLRARANSELSQADAALMAGADVNWQSWVEQRRQLLNQELALCLAAQERFRDAAQKAFGREQAVLALAKRSAKLQDVASARRGYYTS